MIATPGLFLWLLLGADSRWRPGQGRTPPPRRTGTASVPGRCPKAARGAGPRPVWRRTGPSSHAAASVYVLAPAPGGPCCLRVQLLVSGHRLATMGAGSRSSSLDVLHPDGVQGQGDVQGVIHTGRDRTLVVAQRCVAESDRGCRGHNPLRHRLDRHGRRPLSNSHSVNHSSRKKVARGAFLRSARSITFSRRFLFVFLKDFCSWSVGSGTGVRRRPGQTGCGHWVAAAGWGLA